MLPCGGNIYEVFFIDSSCPSNRPRPVRQDRVTLEQLRLSVRRKDARTGKRRFTALEGYGEGRNPAVGMVIVGPLGLWGMCGGGGSYYGWTKSEILHHLRNPGFR